MACSLVASAPRPETVSVGKATSPPLRRIPAARAMSGESAASGGMCRSSHGGDGPVRNRRGGPLRWRSGTIRAETVGLLSVLTRHRARLLLGLVIAAGATRAALV